VTAYIVDKTKGGKQPKGNPLMIRRRFAANTRAIMKVFSKTMRRNSGTCRFLS
jgi:hypothetical protein